MAFPVKLLILRSCSLDTAPLTFSIGKLQGGISVMYEPNELELTEALFNAIAQALEECCHTGHLSAEEYISLLDSVWFSLDFGTRRPR
jgi:hypothetical protein